MYLKTLTPERQVYKSGYRSYNSTLGRFVSRDPIGETGGAGSDFEPNLLGLSPQLAYGISSTLYLAFRNDPVGKVDAFGLWAQWGCDEEVHEIYWCGARTLVAECAKENKKCWVARLLRNARNKQGKEGRCKTVATDVAEAPGLVPKTDCCCVWPKFVKCYTIEVEGTWMACPTFVEQGVCVGGTEWQTPKPFWDKSKIPSHCRPSIKACRDYNEANDGPYSTNSP